MGVKVIRHPRIPVFKISPLEDPFTHQPEVEEFYVEPLDVEKRREDHVAQNKAISITNPEMFDKKSKTEAPTMDGIMSPLFGPDFFNMSGSIDDYYRCNHCGDHGGSIHDGNICRSCGVGTVVYDHDISKTGYIYLGGHRILTPLAYGFVSSYLGSTLLNNILKSADRHDINGRPIIKSKEKGIRKNNKYDGTGLIDFYNKFDEIIEHFRKPNQPDKEELYMFIKKFKPALFTRYVNVYNAILRPAPKDDSKLCLFDVNKNYNIIIKNANSLKMSSEKVIIESALREILDRWIDVYNSIMDNDMDGKNGMYRAKVPTGRVTECMRTLVIPGPDLLVDEIDAPYLPTLEVLTPLVINKIAKIDNISLREAENIVENAKLEYDNRVALILEYLVTRDDEMQNRFIEFLLQRSPTLIREGIRMMRIRRIKKDFTDLTTSVPIAILKGLNMDFDGDTSALYAVYQRILLGVWRRYHSPRYHFISQQNGRYSHYCSFIKDTAVILNYIWEMGKDSNYYEYHKDELLEQIED